MNTRIVKMTLCLGLMSVVCVLAAPLAISATRLPFSSNFETGDFSEWDGGLTGTLTVTSADVSDGRYAVQGRAILGVPTDGYKDYIFGDHVRVGGEPVTPAQGVWLQFDCKFDTGFQFGSSANLHKTAIINFEDENGRRRYQVLVNVWTRSREYYLEHLKWNADRTFNRAMPAFSQNVGTPAQARLGQWDRLLLFVKPNRPGYMDGEVRFWVNGDLKAEHRNVTLREDSPYNPNKLILSHYAMDTTTEGVQRWDNFYLGETDPRTTRPMPPTDVVVE